VCPLIGGVRKGSKPTLLICVVVSIIWTRTVEFEGGMCRSGGGWAIALRVECGAGFEESREGDDRIEDKQKENMSIYLSLDKSTPQHADVSGCKGSMEVKAVHSSGENEV
jgi:hypothetical protein